MGISKTEVNLLRLLDSAPRQQNQAKLIHYVTTSRELLEKLAAENTSEGISRYLLICFYHNVQLVTFWNNKIEWRSLQSTSRLVLVGANVSIAGTRQTI